MPFPPLKRKKSMLNAKRCVVLDCPSVSGRPQHRGVTFHALPLHPETRQAWLTNCKVDLTNQQITTKTSFICSRHFRRVDFHQLKNYKFALKQGAVPTIFPWGTVGVAVEPTLVQQKEEGEATVNVQTEVAASASITTEAVISTTVTTPAALTEPIKHSLVNDIKAELKSPIKRSASADQSMTQLSTTEQPQKKVMRKSLDSAVLKSALTSKNKFNTTDPMTFFVPGAKIEAQDFNEIWHHAKVVEVDSDEREVLIHFEKVAKGTIDEWIPMNSIRLRPIQATPKKNGTAFTVGEKCLARWSDSRKFPATVQKAFENNTYELLFDDGYIKVVRASHMTKIKKTPQDSPKKTISAVSPSTPTSIPDPVAAFVNIPPVTASTPAKPAKPTPRKINPPLPIPKFDLTKLNLLPVPKDGEWCCNWINDTPIGAEGYLDGPDGNKRPTVLVDDWRLPVGWAKHLYQRSSVSGKWDVVLVGPTKKRFRSKNDVKVYLEEHGEVYNPDIYDFSIHKRRAKDIGLFIFTDDYKETLKKKQAEAAAKQTAALVVSTASTAAAAAAAPAPPPPIATPPSLNLSSSDELFTGFPPPDQSLTDYSFAESSPGTPLIGTAESFATLPLEEGYIYVGALKVQIVDNLFRCPDKSCQKNFRKENHLQIHVKHYHEDLAKLLGVCPNMTDLAYHRTMGTPFEEPAPRNQIPNSQFFEKVYQSELSSKTPRKSISSPTPAKLESKAEIKTEHEIPVVAAAEVIPHVEVAMEIDVEMLKKEDVEIKDESELPHVVNVQVLPHSPPKQGSIIDSESMIQAFSINKTVQPSKAGRPKKGFKIKLKSGKMKKSLNRYNKQKARSSYIKDKQPSKRLKYLKKKPLAKGMGLEIPQPLHQNVILDASGAPTSYINENGETIKLVRMRQEEIINCVCLYGEEDGLMIQCELCLCWQHSTCNGYEKESQVPEKYVCYICKNPYRGRESMKYIHDQDWLYDGKLPLTNYHVANAKHAERFEMLKKSHTLTGNLLEFKHFLHSLKVKMNIAENKDHPKMYLWSKKWENSPPRNTTTELSGIEPLNSNADVKRPNPQQQQQLDDKSSSMKIEEVKAEIESPLCASGEQSGQNVTPKQSVATPQQATPPVSTATTRTPEGGGNGEDHNALLKANDLDGTMLAGLLTSPGGTNIDFTAVSDIKVQSTPKPSKMNIPQPEAAIDPAECQLRLLEHIQKQQALALTRLNSIEDSIIALEAMDDTADTLEPVESFSRTKQTIAMLLNDLTKMKKLAIVNTNVVV